MTKSATYMYAALLPALLLTWAPASRLAADDQPCRDPDRCTVDDPKNLGNGKTMTCLTDTTIVTKDLLDNPIPPTVEPVPQWSTKEEDNDPEGWHPAGHCAHWWTIDQKHPDGGPVKGGECGGQGIGKRCHNGA